MTPFLLLLRHHRRRVLAYVRQRLYNVAVVGWVVVRQDARLNTYEVEAFRIRFRKARVASVLGTKWTGAVTSNSYSVNDAHN